VVGYDDHRLISETLYPALTTAELPYSAMGARAAQILLELMAGEAEAPSERIRVGGQVQHRASLVAPAVTVSQNIISLKRRKKQ
ncbi:MAG: substrate-binding domain-containing protein, partial [Pseudomonadota bacterium]